MQLSKQTLEKMDDRAAAYFLLPEKVLQFGTGVLLRGLPDYYIDKANKQNIFNGRVVMVKSTEGNMDVFEKQDCLYTLAVRGIADGKIIEENSINTSVSRVLSAKKDWDKLLKCAADKHLSIIISNTTETGIQLMNDDIHAAPPVSFPGKLLAFLYQRYTFFNGDMDKGFVIIPTELITNNGNELLRILSELANQNRLETSFLHWLKSANYFCNSLVDRIVPGKLTDVQQQEFETKNGYTDDLVIMAESYNLWAIETANHKVKDIVSFSKADSGVVIVPDISVFRELKLRLLNGAHTLSCGLAHLAGFTTVKEAMNHAFFNEYVSKLMHEEIAQAIAGDTISLESAKEFAAKVLDRFRNPYMEHRWLNITLQYSSKMAMRNISTLKKFARRFDKVPGYIALGFAGYLLFTKPVEYTNNHYYGSVNNKLYHINDDKAAWYYELWQNNNYADLVIKALANESLWGSDLTLIKGFADTVKSYLEIFIHNGAAAAIKSSIKS